MKDDRGDNDVYKGACGIEYKVLSDCFGCGYRIGFKLPGRPWYETHPYAKWHKTREEALRDLEKLAIKEGLVKINER